MFSSAITELREENSLKKRKLAAILQRVTEGEAGNIINSRERRA